MRALAVLVVLCSFPALAQEPRGVRTPRPVATHLIISETALTTGGAPATLVPGMPVVVKGAVPARGKIKIATAGNVEVSGTVDAAAVGLCVIEDTPLMNEGEEKKKDAVARALLRPGALVKVVSLKGDQALVESAGLVKARGMVAKKSLSPRATEVVLDRDWQVAVNKGTDLWAEEAFAGKPLAHFEAGAHLQLVEQRGDKTHVRSVGGVVAEGWVLSFDLSPRSAPPAPAADPQLVKPTHEVFVDAPIFADPAGKKKLGMLRGGALVEANRKSIDEHFGDKAAIKNGLIKVTTPAPAIVEGWMKQSDLRDLAAAGDAIK